MKRAKGIEENETVNLRLLEVDNERRLLRNNRIILLTDDINHSVAQAFIEDVELLSLKGKEPIKLIIASPGGDAFAGYAIIRAMRRAQAKGIRFIGEVHGHAMSMAFFILQCCDERIMGKLDNLMCHGITTFTIGDMKNVEAERKIMRKFQKDIAALIAERNTNPSGSKYKQPKYWHEVLEDNTPQFYDSDESLRMGIVDRIED